MEKTGTDPDWGFGKRIAFRFAFAYLVLYNFPFPLNAIYEAIYSTDFFLQKSLGFLVEKYNDLWHAVVPWVGKHILHLSYDITVFSNGSGDTTYDYVLVLCFLTLAAAATAIWTLLDRKRAGYEKLDRWLRGYVRFALATAMISYGAVKVIKTQFPDPSPDRLLQPFGDASPMGLLWTFMGASESYTVFTGAAEIVGGLLLFTRRTTMLGSLVCIGVLSNVVMLNFSYDVPVKLYSSHLLAMAVFLIAPDLKRLADVLVLNRKVEAVEFRPLFTRTWLNRSAQVVQVLFVLFIAGSFLFESYKDRKNYIDARSPLYGVWSVEEFEVDGEVRPPLVTDETRWRRVIFSYPDVLAVQLMSGSRRRFTLDLDVENKTLALGKRDDSDWKADLSFERPDSELITLEGKVDGRSIRAKLRRADESEFLLTSRGFHWISEYPFNR